MTKKQKEIMEMMKDYEQKGLATCRNVIVDIYEMRDGENFAQAFVQNDKLYMAVNNIDWPRKKDLTRGYDTFKNMVQTIAENLSK